MKRALWMTLALALLLAVPAVSQDKDTEMELKVELDKLKKTVAQQGEAIKLMHGWMLAQQGQARTLAGKLKEAEKKGFLSAGSNIDAKKALLDGLKGVAKAAAGGAAADAEEKKEE